MQTNEKFIKVDKWNYDPETALVNFDGKLLSVHFDRCIEGLDDERIKYFKLNKGSYINKSPLIARYINYFLEFYDNDKELIIIYFRLKYLIDNKTIKLPVKKFIKTMYKVLFTKSMIVKVKQMTDDNYYMLLSDGDDKKYNQSVQLTDEHGKLLNSISTMMKIMAPIVGHYTKTRVKADVEDFFQFFQPIFEDQLMDKNINIYNKLFKTVFKRFEQNNSYNIKSWNNHEILNGEDVSDAIERVVKHRIIADVMPKYTFNGNVNSLNIATINHQLRFSNRGKYKYTLHEIGTERGPDGLSEMDRYEMNMSKIDESLVTLSNINISHTIKKIKKRYNIEVTQKEIDFYLHHIEDNSIVEDLISAYYAKFFNGYVDLEMMPDQEFMELTIILKKKLFIDGNKFLPMILTSNILSDSNRVIKNSKFISKLEECPLYHKVMEKFEAVIELKGENVVIKIISKILNTKFSMVEYSARHRTGEVLDYVQNTLAYEILEFLYTI